MNDKIKAIAFTLCGIKACDLGVGCPRINVPCPHIESSERVYTAHVKPLEEALTKAKAQNYAVLTEQAAKLLQGVTTGITGDAGSFQVDMCITCPHCGLVMDSVEEATAHDAVCEKHPAVIRAVKAEADKTVLVETLEKLARLGNGDSYGNSEGNCIAQAALAKVKCTGTIIENTDQTTYVFGTEEDGDYWYEDIGHALESWEDVETEDEKSMFMGEATSYTHAGIFNASDLIDSMREYAYELASDNAEDYLQDISKEKLSDLHGVIVAWFDANVPQPVFFTVENIREIEVRFDANGDYVSYTVKEEVCPKS